MCNCNFCIKFHYLRKIFRKKHKIPQPSVNTNTNEWVDVDNQTDMDKVKRVNNDIEITKLEIKDRV